MEDFWADSLDFPTQGAGGFIGQTPPAIVGQENKLQRKRGEGKHGEDAPAGAGASGNAVPQIRTRRHKRKPAQQKLPADEIYRLGPSLQNQWWKVKRKNKNKKKKKPRKQELKSASTPSVSLPAIDMSIDSHDHHHFHHMPETSFSSILLDYDAESARMSSSPRPSLLSMPRKDPSMPASQPAAEALPSSSRPPPRHDDFKPRSKTSKQSNTSKSTKSSQPDRTIDRPFGSEVLDLVPPIMARVLDPYVMRYFALLDPEGHGVLRKRHLVNSARHSFRTREFLRKCPPALRLLCRRPGFVSGIAALKTEDPTQCTFLEFRDYALGITERREAERALEERRERKKRREERRRRKIEREEAIKDEVERQKLNAANLLAEAQKRIEKEMVETAAIVAREREILEDIRVDAKKEVNQSRHFANKTRVQAASTAMDIVKEGARNARAKEEMALKKDAEIRGRRARDEARMRKTTDNAKNKVLLIKLDAQQDAEDIVNAARDEAEKIRSLAHEKALDFQRETEERRKVAEDIVTKAQVEVARMKRDMQKEHEATQRKDEQRGRDIRNAALEEAGGIRKRAEVEAKDIHRRAEEAGNILLEQIKIEQTLHRQRVEEEKEASIRQSRADMVLVLDRAKQKAKMLIEDAQEKRAAILEQAQAEAKRIVEVGKQTAENAEALANLKGSVRAETEKKLRRMEKARADKQRLEAAALKRSRRKRSIALVSTEAKEDI